MESALKENIHKLEKIQMLFALERHMNQIKILTYHLNIMKRATGCIEKLLITMLKRTLIQ